MAKLLWTERTNFGPAARRGHALVFDTTRGRSVLFGGRVGDTFLGDTWEWDGRYWTQMQDIGPSPRAGCVAAFDRERRWVVLFGGLASSDGSSFGDTWMWDGELWTQLADSGPAPRWGAASAYDPLRKRTVLFGGVASDGTVLRDTWEFDGEEWGQVEDTGPSARRHHALAFDSSSHAVLLFGGVDAADNDCGDTWSWNGSAWSQHAGFGPSSRSHASMATTSASVVLFGGGFGLEAAGRRAVTLFRDTWGFDGRRWTELQDIGPGARYDHAICHDDSRDRVLLFGGATFDPATSAASAAVALADTWEHLPIRLVTLPIPTGPVVEPLDGLLINPASAVAGATVTATIHLAFVLDHPIQVVLLFMPLQTLESDLEAHVNPATILSKATLITTVAVPPLTNLVTAQFAAPSQGRLGLLAATDASFFVYAQLQVT